MKDYIKRYIYAVTRRLPMDMRDEVEEELKAHINDLLSDDPDEEEIDKVLHDFGHPREIASNYDERKRFVIAPEFYADYLLTLRITLIAAGIFALFFSALNALLSVDQETVWQAIGYVTENILNGTFDVLVYTFTIVTVVFWIVSSDKVKKHTKRWKLKALMEVPKDYKSQKYHSGKAIFALVFQVIAAAAFITVLVYYLERFGIYEQDIMVAPLFGMSVINPFIPFLIISQVFSIGAQAMLVAQRKYSLSMLTIYTIGAALSSILSIVIIQSNGFITDSFITIAAQNAGMARGDLAHTFTVLITVLTVLIILGTIGDLFTQWRKLFKPLTKDKKKA